MSTLKRWTLSSASWKTSEYGSGRWNMFWLEFTQQFHRLWLQQLRKIVILSRQPSHGYRVHRPDVYDIYVGHPEFDCYYRRAFSGWDNVAREPCWVQTNNTSLTRTSFDVEVTTDPGLLIRGTCTTDVDPSVSIMNSWLSCIFTGSFLYQLHNFNRSLLLIPSLSSLYTRLNKQVIFWMNKLSLFYSCSSCCNNLWYWQN